MRSRWSVSLTSQSLSTHRRRSALFPHHIAPNCAAPCAEEISKLQDKHADMQRTHQMLQDDYNKLEESMTKAQATADSAATSLKKLQSDYETLHTRVG